MHDASDQLAARQTAEQLLEQGWGRSILIEPLTALAGGILGGALVTGLAIAAGRRTLERRR